MSTAKRSSGGCFACKERKVKCDEQKPSCKKCLALKRQCPGYRDSWLTKHRGENEHVAKLVQARVDKKLRERQRRDAGAREAVVISRSVDFSTDTYVLNHFYNDYAVDTGVGFLGVLPSISSASPTLCFLDAIHATALASSSRQLGQQQLMAQAKRRFGKAVVGVNEVLQNMESRNTDSVLATLFLFGLFEAVVAQPSLERPVDTETTCHAHSRGALSLLQYRSRMNLDGELDRKVLTFFTYIALMELFLSPPGFHPLWSELRHFRSRWADGPPLEPLVRRAVDLKASVEETIPSQAHTVEASDALLLRRCAAVIADLDAASEESLRATADYPDTPAASSFNGLLTTSNRVTAVIASCLYLTVRQHMIELVLSLMITTRGGSDAAAEGEGGGYDEMGLLSQQGLANLGRMCDHVRQVFGFDGDDALDQKTPGQPFRIWCMMWPMAAVMSSCLADVATKMWVMDKFGRIGKATGFGLAMI